MYTLKKKTKSTRKRYQNKKNYKKSKKQSKKQVKKQTKKHAKKHEFLSIWRTPKHFEDAKTCQIVLNHNFDLECLSLQ